MKHLPGKKVIVFIVIILIITIGVLWYFGNKKKSQDQALTAAEEKVLLEQNSKLKQVVSEALARKGTLKTFRYSDLPRRASTTDLKITTKVSTSTLKAYGLGLASILKPYEAERENEGKVMLRFLEKRDPKDLETLKRIALIYQNTDRELLTVPTPKEAAYLHTKLINRVRVMSALARNMSLVLEEPVLALESAEAYQKELALFYKTTEELSNYFKSKQIVFEPQEKINIYVNLES